MRLYLQSAALADVSWAADIQLVDGVLTSPALLADEVGPSEMLARLQEICRAIQGPVIASVTSIDADAMYRDGRDLARFGDQLVVEVPFVEEAIGTIRRLSGDGIRVAAGLVFNAAQALLAAKAGASTVIVPFRELDAHGQSGTDALAEIRAVFDAAGTECDVLALLPGTPGELAQCALAGADAVAVSVGVLRRMLLHPLTDRGVDHFLNVLSHIPKARAGA